MIHRFLILAAPSGLDRLPSGLLGSVEAVTGGWDSAFDSGVARAWVFSSHCTRLGYRPLSLTEGNGCLIGRDFARQCAGVIQEGCDILLRERWGAYVALRIDSARREVRILRDPTGRINCWRYQSAGYDLFFSHLEDVLDLFDRTLTFNWPNLLFHSSNRNFHGNGTGYLEICEVMPGEEVVLAPGGSNIVRRWDPSRLRERPLESIEEVQAEFRQAAEEAVSEWSALYETITLDLSGGLDSAIVLGLLRQTAKHQGVIGINYLIDHPEGDERRFAQDAADRHKIELLVEDMREAVSRPPPSARMRLLRPGLRTIPLGYDQAGISAADRTDADAFCTGTGGDHIFCHNLTDAVAIDHFRNHGISGLITAAHETAQISKSHIWSVLGRVVRHQFGERLSIDDLIKFENPLFTASPRDWVNEDGFVDTGLLRAIGRLSPAEVHQMSDLIELQAHYWRYGRADRVEELHPLVSQPLMEIALRTPMNWFNFQGSRRGLAKSIFSDLLPESIRDRRSKSSNSSHWIRVVIDNLPAYRELLLEGRLAHEGLLDRDLVDRSLKPLALTESKYLAELMSAISIEQWITDHTPKPPAFGVAA